MAATIPTAITDSSQIDWPPAPEASTLHHPRILCLHGGGTNARIFHMQCRGLALRLKAQFRLVFVEAPFPATAGPDVLTVYADCGPFKRWVITTAPNAVERKPAATWRAIEDSIGLAMRRDDGIGATGDWVAVLGFSQGAKIAATLLWRQQQQQQVGEQGKGGLAGMMERVRGMGARGKVDFRCGVLMAGRGPFIPLVFDEKEEWEEEEETTGEREKEKGGIPKKKTWLMPGERFDYESNRAANRVIRDVPTIHVHGLQDPGIEYHRILEEDWCEPGTTTLIEWEGNHRLPIKTADVVPVVDALVACLQREGVRLPVPSTR